MTQEQYTAVLSSLEALCSKKEYCTSEVRQKALSRLEGDAQKADEIVYSLCEHKFVDDARYATCFAREKAALTGWGPIKITYALRLKGIAEEIIKEAINQIDSSKADAKLRKVLEDKWSKLQGDPYCRFKLTRFALSRGYDYDSIRVLLDEITKQ